MTQQNYFNSMSIFPTFPLLFAKRIGYSIIGTPTEDGKVSFYLGGFNI